MACQYTYQGKTYTAEEFKGILRSMVPMDAAKFMPNVESLPNAPFVGRTEAWVSLALKKMIRLAAEEGFDRLSWTRGDQQAERYDLSKQIDRVAYNHTTGQLMAWKKGTHKYEGAIPEIVETVPLNKADDYIGKEAAERLAAAPKEKGIQALSGLDLKIGGRGMAAFYDKIVPNVANALLKKLGGGRVGEITIEMPNAHPEKAPVDFQVESRQPSFDLTPALRASALRGLPLFSRGQRPPGLSLAAALHPPNRQRVLDWFRPKLDAARVKLQDRFLMLQRHQQAVEARRGPLSEETDAYLALTLYHGRAEDRMKALKAKHLDPLIEAIHTSGASIAQVDDFLYALHAEERNLLIASRNPKFDPESEKYGGVPGSGMTREEAEAILQAARDAGLYDKLMAISKQVQALNGATLDGRVADGLMSQEQADEWRSMWKHYVPLRGVEGQDELPRIGHGFNIQGAESKRAFGRASKAGDLLAHVVSQAEEAVIRGEKNRVGQAFLKFVEENEGPWQVKNIQFKPRLDPETGEMRFERDPFYTLAPNVLTVKRDGKEVHIQLEDEQLARSLKNLGAEDSGAIVRTMGKLTRALSFLSTSANPEFLISNFARDLQEAGINLAGEQGAAMAKKVMKNVPKALRGAYRAIRKGDTTDPWAKHFREMRAAGGLVGHLDSQSIEKQAGRLEGMLKDLDPSKPRKVLIALRGIGHLIQDSNTVVESGVRLSAYVAARKAGMSIARAAELAKNLTVNFNRRGELGPVMNSLYMFFNAGIQGTTRMIQALGHPRTQKIVGGIVGLGVLLEILNQSMSGSGDDDKKYYDQIPTWVKDHNLILMMPDGKHYAMLPLPYGYNTFHALGRNVGSLFFGAKPIDAAGAILHAGLDAFNPLGGAGSVLQAISPTLLDPLVQQAENLTHFGTPIKPGQSPFGPPKPESTLYWNSVNPVAKDVATWLNDATGGSPVRPGAIDFSPEILQHWTEFMAGGVGKTFMKAVNTGTRLATGEDLPVKEVPFLRRVFGEPDERSSAGVYREHLNEVVRARNEIRYFRKAGDPARAAEVAREHGAEMRLYPMAHAIDQQVSALHSRLKLLESRGASRQVRDTLAKRIEALKAKFIRRYEAATATP